MIDKDVTQEAKKIEQLAARSLDGDKDAATALAKESQAILQADKQYKDQLQARLEADRKASNGLLPEISIQYPLQVVVEKEEHEVVTTFTGDAVIDPATGKPKLRVKDIDRQTFYDDGAVGVSPNDKLATTDHLERINDFGMPAREVAASGVLGDPVLKTDAQGRVTSIARAGGLTTIEYDNGGNPTKIEGINGQKWTKNADNSWNVVGEKGVVETKTDVVVLPNGDILSKGVVRMGHDSAQPGANPTPEPYSEVLHADGTREVTYPDKDGTQTVVAEGAKVYHYRGIDKFGMPLRDEQGKPIIEVDTPTRYVMQKDAAGQVRSIERDGKTVEFEYDANGNPTKISGLEGGVTMKLDPNGLWSILDAEGRYLESRADAVVKPNGDIESKQIEFSSEAPYWIKAPQTVVVHPDGKVITRKDAAPAAQGTFSPKKVDSDLLGGTTFTKGQCLPSDPLCSEF